MSDAADTSTCPYCGCAPHSAIALCPRVESIDYFKTGEIKRVTFRAPTMWSWSPTVTFDTTPIPPGAAVVTTCARCASSYPLGGYHVCASVFRMDDHGTLTQVAPESRTS